MPETLFTISTSDATITFVQTLGAGDDGEALAFNPDDGFLYHASGFDFVIFESIDLTLPSNISNIDITGNARPANEIPALTYSHSDAVFFCM